MFESPNIRPVRGSEILTPHLVRHAVLVGALTIALATDVCQASDLDIPPVTPEAILLAQRAIEDTLPPPPPAPVPPAEGPVPAEEAEAAVKSPGRAFVLNLLVPGAGHLYAGNKRGWIHLGLEGATWVTYLYYHDRGKSKEDEYEAYADQNWDKSRWTASDTYTPEREQLIDNFYANNKQQYYEDIGKLDYYWTGWSGYNAYPAAGGDAPSRRFYYGIRNDSNNFLKNARYALVGGFVNRVVSAVDVLRLLKNRGRANLGNDTQIKFNMRTRPFSNENALKITVTRRLG